MQMINNRLETEIVVVGSGAFFPKRNKIRQLGFVNMGDDIHNSVIRSLVCFF